MRFLPAVLLGRLARIFIRQFRKGGGSALPGLILSKVAPGLLYKTLRSFKDGLVIVTGSAGKSTTTKMIVAIARAHGKNVFTNPSTANILQGFYSTIIEQSNLFGKISADIAILEMDEGHAAQLVKSVAPKTVAILNVMEDQLDRFVDPALVRDTLAKVALSATSDVVLNADDENMRLIAEALNGSAKLSWFGITADVLETQRNGLGTAPTYLPSLPRPDVSSEVTAKSNLLYDVDIAGHKAKIELASRGLHFAVDAICALETARKILGPIFDPSLAASTISELPPVFARGEVVEINGEEVEFVLVQNPGSMQLNLDNLMTDPEQIMFAIGRDVHDASWLWTVDYSGLDHIDVVAGFNAAEAALLLTYVGVPFEAVEYDLDKAIEKFFAMPKPSSGRKTVVFSADAMRRMRRALGFWSPDEVRR
jgi:UDP-N-acetylmuramyl pentapeptide synthase